MQDQKELQQKFMEMQMLEQQMQQVQKQIQLIEQQTFELEITRDSIDEIGKTKPGTDALVPMSSGIFVKAEIKDNKKLRVNVGAGVVVEKTISEAKDMIEDQLKEMKDFKQELSVSLNKLSGKIQEIEIQLQKIMK